MSQAFVSKNRLYFLVFLILVSFFVLFIRLIFLHIFESEKLIRYANDVRQSYRVLPSKRGDILDVNGNILAATHASYNLGVDPNFIKDKDKHLWPHLAFILDIPYERLRNIIQKKVNTESGRLIRWSILAKNIDLKTYEKVKELGITGVYGNRVDQRIYPGNDLAAHVIGFVNHESTAIIGIEKMCDYYLRGQDGWIETNKDGKRKELAHKRFRHIEPKNGHNIFLTIDQRIQSSAEKVIENLVEDFGPESISIIVSIPKDGSILSMANYPSFNLNKFNNTKLNPISHQKNRSITDVYEPGSTFKIVSSAAVLNEKIVKVSDIFDTSMTHVQYKNYNIEMPKDHKEYSQLSMKDIVVKSSNKGAAQFGMKLGEDLLYDYASSFGFGEITKLGLPGEVSGKLYEVKNWDRLTISRLPIGYSINATPLQVHFATSVIANGGILMKPRIIEKITNSNGEEILIYPSVIRRRVIDFNVSKEISLILGKVVSDGTAKNAFIEGFSVAGKTGTTQNLVNGAYSNKSHTVSFTGFLPLDNPQVVITVVIKSPRVKSGVAYGGSIAAPAFKQVAEDCIRYLQIKESNYLPY